MFTLSIQSTLPYIEAIGTFAFCIAGFIRAQQSKFDVVGSFVIAFVTAFGGGTLRDILLDRRPFFWVEQQNYIWFIFFASFFASSLIKLMQRVMTEKSLIFTDALGMGLFAITSTTMALDKGLPYFSSVIMGVIGATFGGVIRDVLCGDSPHLLKDSTPYASCAFIGAWLYIGMLHLDFEQTFSLAVSASAAVLIRLATAHLNIKVPKSY